MRDKEQILIDLRKALEDDNISALRLLAAMKPEVDVLKLFLPRIIDLAIDSSSPDRIVLSREVLAQHKDDSWVKSNIQKLITSYLADNDEWQYRRIAELYAALSYKEELAAFLVLCQASVNVEIQEISSDYTGYYS
jgi:hypothetical protein